MMNEQLAAHQNLHDFVAPVRGRRVARKKESASKRSELLDSIRKRRHKKKICLFACVVALTFMTHMDVNTVGLSHVNFRSGQFYFMDKLFHFSGYSILTFIVLFTATSRQVIDGGRVRVTSAKKVLVWSFVVLLYGIADETTQPFFGRSCEIADFIADAVGISVGQTTFVVCEAFGIRRFLGKIR